MALTPTLIDKFVYEEDGAKPDYRWDTKYGKGGVKAFALRVYPSGYKSFVMAYRMDGDINPRWHTLGSCEQLKAQWEAEGEPKARTYVDYARDQAHRLLGRVRQGIHPKTSDNIKSSMTLTQFSEVFLADMQARNKATLSEMRRRIEKRLKPALGDRVLTDITRADVNQLHAKIGRTAKIESNRCIQLLRTMYSRAEKLGYIAAGSLNPAKGIDLFPEQSRSRYLDEAELQRLLTALKEETLLIQCLIMLYLCTGLRKSELLGLAWKDVYLDHPEGAHVDVSNTKNGRDLRLALSPQAVDLFKALQSQYQDKTPYCFPSEVRGFRKPLADFKRQWTRIRNSAGLPDVTVHDLRRTVGSRMAQSGVPLEHIAQVLNHRDPAITAVYARLSQDTQRDALIAAGRDLEELLGPLSTEGAAV